MNWTPMMKATNTREHIIESVESLIDNLGFPFDIVQHRMSLPIAIVLSGLQLYGIIQISWFIILSPIVLAMIVRYYMYVSIYTTMIAMRNIYEKEKKDVDGKNQEI
jgi:hypothetical protein